MAEALRPASLKASTVARVHTVLAYTAFTSALILGCLLHYKKIVKNGVAGYPQEWFPSVSATIGDWYPERNIFQILIALTSGPRFALVYLQYYLHVQRLPERAFWSKSILATGIIRTVSCGGWVYITSSDSHDAHDFFMILYMVCNLPWMIGGILSSKDRRIRKQRTWVSSMFFFTIVPLIYFFIQHKVYRIPGAYTHYAFFEWSLIFFDVLYDSISEREFQEANLKITLGVTLRDRSSDQISTGKSSSVEKKKTAVETSTMSVGDSTTTTVEHISSSQWCTEFISATRPLLSVLSDVYLSYVFQTLFTALIPSLFYFSIWELGIAGQELALCAVLSPFLFGFSAVRSFSKGRTGQVILQTLSLSGLLAYTLKKPLHRLAVVTPSVAIGLLAATATWVSNDGGYQAAVFGLSWIAASLVKHANHSNNPLWPFIHGKSGGYNKTGLVLAIVALVEQATRSQKVSKLKAPGTSNTPKAHWLTVALPLGSLVFSIHNMLAESSTLVAWSWTGYENGVPRGPLPHVHSALTIVLQSLGLAFALYGYLPSTNAVQSNGVKSQSTSDKNLSSNHSNAKDIKYTFNLMQPIINSPLFFVFGATLAYILYNYKNWTGYSAGLGLSFFLMAIIPVIFERLASIANMEKAPIGRTLGTAFVVYCLLNLASIFTVAYAFVPGGVYFRERTDLVLIAQFALLLPLYLSPRPKGTSQNAITWSYGLPGTKAIYIFLLLSVFSILSGIVTVYRLPSSAPQPFRPGPRIIRAGIWTIHFGFDNEGHDSQRGVRNLIRDMELDIVGLLETDLHRTSFGHRDLTRVIVEDMGYNVDIGPGPNQHTWGCVLLSKFPIINSTHHLLPSPHGELAPAIEAVLDIHGTEVTVIVSHNGQEEDPLDRELQSTELARIMSASYPKPIIFLGYVVTKPHAKRPNPYEIMTVDGRVHDIDSDDVDRWCEYIFYRGLYRTSYARVSRGIITDTEMQIGQFVLPRHGATVTDESAPARYLRSPKEKLPVEHWFPMEYYGGPGRGGVDGHHYHVFNTPLYYDIPEGAVM